MTRSSRLSCLALVSIALAIAACSDSSGDDASSGDGTLGDTDGDGDGDGDTSGDGDGDGDTSGDGDGDGDTSGDGDGDGGGLDCTDPDPEVSFGFGFGGFVALGEPEPNVDWTCTINQLDVSEGLSVELDCPAAPQPIVVTISATPAFSAPLTGNETIQLRYASFAAGVDSTYLRLDVAGEGHLLTLIDGDTLAPPPELMFEHFTEITTSVGVCAPTPYFCGERERVAVAVDLGDAELYEVLDGQHGVIGAAPGTDVWVEEAYLNITACEDEPVGRARVLLAKQG